MIAIVGAEVCGFNLMPIYLTVGLLVPCVYLFLLSLWLSIGDMFLKFALEDERFYLLALERRALDVFEDTELSSGSRAGQSRGSPQFLTTRPPGMTQRDGVISQNPVSGRGIPDSGPHRVCRLQR